MLTDDELPPLPTPEFLLKWVDGSEYRVTRPNVGDTDVFTADQMREYACAVEQAAYERAAAHVRTLKRDWWRLRAAPEIVVEECAVAIEKLMTQEQPR